MSLLVGVVVRPSGKSDDDDPGHLIVYWSDESVQLHLREARGFGFRVSDLPEGFQDQGQWRGYLFDHKIPGYIQDEVMMLDHFLHHPLGFSCYNWHSVSVDQSVHLADLVPGARFGWYSFNPDDFPSDPIESGMTSARCHNCVTWGIEVINCVVGMGSLPQVRQGRIKLIVQVLENM